MTCSSCSCPTNCVEPRTHPHNTEDSVRKGTIMWRLSSLIAFLKYRLMYVNLFSHICKNVGKTCNWLYYIFLRPLTCMEHGEIVVSQSKKVVMDLIKRLHILVSPNPILWDFYLQPNKSVWYKHSLHVPQMYYCTVWHSITQSVLHHWKVVHCCEIGVTVLVLIVPALFLTWIFIVAVS